MTATGESTIRRGRPPVPDEPPAPQRFPGRGYRSAGSYFAAYAAAAATAAVSVDPVALDRAASVLAEAYQGGATVFACGNGGSAAIANHMHCDHVKGIRTATELSPRVVSLSSNVEMLTAVANDIGYAEIFAYQLSAQARPGDVLVAISSSGRSPNIVQCLRWARAHRLRTIALTGFRGGEARTLAEVSIHIDATNYGVVEDQHQAIMHSLAQYLRQAAMAESAITASVF